MRNEINYFFIIIIKFLNKKIHSLLANGLRLKDTSYKINKLPDGNADCQGRCRKSPSPPATRHRASTPLAHHHQHRENPNKE